MKYSNFIFGDKKLRGLLTKYSTKLSNGLKNLSYPNQAPFSEIVQEWVGFALPHINPYLLFSRQNKKSE